MNESHVSMREDFEISTAALDAMVEIAQVAAGGHGARMTGGGFGGCVVALVDEVRAEDFLAVVGRSFRARTGLTPSLYLCRPQAGTSLVE
jgi:galactokinase